MAHLYDLRSEVEDQEMVDRFAQDWRVAGLDPATNALLLHAEKLTRTPAACSEQDVNDLRSAGWSDRAITDAVQVCSYFNYINRIAEGLGVDEEEWLDAVGKQTADSRQQTADSRQRRGCPTRRPTSDI